MDKKIQLLAIVTLPFLTICGLLYHVSFWAFFRVNALSFITFSNILTSAFEPVVYTTFPPLVLYVFSFSKVLKSGFGNMSRIMTITLIIVCVITLVVFILSHYNEDLLFFVSTLALAFAVTIQSHLYLTKSSFPNSFIHRVLLVVIIHLPIFCAQVGVLQALKIKDNKKYYFTILTVGQRSDTLKILYSSEDGFLLTDKKNSTIYFRKTDTLSIYYYSERATKSRLNPSKPPLVKN